MIDRLIRCFFALTVVAMPALAQSYGQSVPLRLGSTLLNMPTGDPLSAGRWEVRFAHRFAQAINDGDAHSLWGLDGAADIAFGLAWGATDRTQLSIFRTDVQDDVEVAIEHSFRSQAHGASFSLAGRAGADVRTEVGLEDRTSGFAQVVASKQFGDRLVLFVVPSWASKAGSFDDAFNVPVAMAWMLRRDTALIVEVVPGNRDLPESVPSDFAWSVGIKKSLGGHYFDLMLSNTRATHVSQYVAGEVLPGIGLDAGDIHLGFNIVRLFGGK